MNENSPFKMHHCGLTFIHIVVTINNNTKEQDQQLQLRMFILVTGLGLLHVSASTGHLLVTQNNETVCYPKN
jgi:hypothetical protein